MRRLIRSRTGSRPSLKGKVEAGAQFSQTQFCMDAGVHPPLSGAAVEAGINLPMLVGVNPLRSAKSANWMRNNLFGTIIPDSMIERMEKAADPAAEGQQDLRRIYRGTAPPFRASPACTSWRRATTPAVPDVITRRDRKIARAKL